ncbi:hypothetical protein [Chryseobacterium lathyri]|uniref:hypothetical protein n=1 Tax=Chryseobacterium lathyri TaxID=395933 RepID=UPI002780B2F1|nr:hypothetical protein [Chryseobacterium lathyri]MDQ0068155.1 hypothetical protein [Chryseobacterium lathyri]
MKNNILLLMFLIAGNMFVTGQVGILTSNPQGSFHIDGAKDNSAAGIPPVAQQANDVVVTSQGSVGIGTIAPNTSSALEVNSANRGFLPPRVTLTSATDATTIPTPATGLTVYNLGNAALEAGLYSNVGTPAAPRWNKGAIIDTNSGGVVKKLIYRGNADLTKTVQAGLFEWRLAIRDATYIALQARLIAQPTTSVTIQGPRIGWKPPNVVPIATIQTWTTTDWNSWKEIDFQANEASHLLYLDVSTTDDFYRVSFYTRRNIYESLLVEVY